VAPPLGRTITDVLVASRGNLEIFGFHALETLQCMAERRDRKGKPQGVKSVTYPEGDAVWRAADQGVWSWELLRHALGRSHTVNPGDIKQNTRDFAAPATRDAATILNRPDRHGFWGVYTDVPTCILGSDGHKSFFRSKLLQSPCSSTYSQERQAKRRT
jgi:hypothetical protein